jgi:hypothetical protein
LLQNKEDIENKYRKKISRVTLKKPSLRYESGD